MTDDAKFFGVHACQALVTARPRAVQRAYFLEATAKRFGPLMSSLAERRRPYRVVDDEELSRVAGTQHHEGVCLVADEIPNADLIEELERVGAEPARWVFLDGVRNPHNIGAILRTAAHFGRSALAGYRPDLGSISGATARVAEGGAEYVPVMRWQDPRAALAETRRHGFVLVATVARDGRDLFEVELPKKSVFLVGAEGTGLGDAALDIADIGVTIRGTGAVDSLNVASAAAVLLAEHARRYGE